MGCGNSVSSPSKVIAGNLNTNVAYEDKIGKISLFTQPIKPITSTSPKSLELITVPLDKSTKTTCESEKSSEKTTTATNKQKSSRSTSPADTRRTLDSVLDAVSSSSSSPSPAMRSRPTSPSGMRRNSQNPSSNRSTISGTSPSTISRPISPISTNKPGRRASDFGSRPTSSNTNSQKTPPKRRNSSASAAASVNVSAANSRANSRPTTPRREHAQRRNSKSFDDYSYIGDKCHQQGSALKYHEYGRYHVSDIAAAVAQAKRALDGSLHGIDDNEEEVKPKGKFHKDAAHRKRSI